MALLQFYLYAPANSIRAKITLIIANAFSGTLNTKKIINALKKKGIFRAIDPDKGRGEEVNLANNFTSPKPRLPCGTAGLLSTGYGQIQCQSRSQSQLLCVWLSFLRIGKAT